MSHAKPTVLPSVAVPLAEQEIAETEIVWTIVVAGGSATRFGRPKQYELLDDRRMIDHSVGVARAAGFGVVVVVPAADVPVESGVFDFVVAGGDTRSASVRAGLAVVPNEATIVCVHDGARPFASADLYRRVIAAVHGGADAAVPGIAVTDTIKVIDDHGVVVQTPPRDSLVAVQTPQAFRADVLRAAHAAGGDGTDDAALVERFGRRVQVVLGEVDNRKVTHPADLDWARAKVHA